MRTNEVTELVRRTHVIGEDSFGEDTVKYSTVGNHEDK